MLAATSESRFALIWGGTRWGKVPPQSQREYSAIYCWVVVVDRLLDIGLERLQKSHVEVGVEALPEPEPYVRTIVLLHNGLVVAPDIVVKRLAINHELDVLRVIVSEA